MLKVESVSHSYHKQGWLTRGGQQVLHEISFEWRRGECLGIIGESGSGKSTLGRLLLGIEKPDAGTVRYNGQPVTRRKTRRGAISAVFQDYRSSIHPFYTVQEALMEPLRLLELDASPRRLAELLQQVGLAGSYLAKYPHELSGGEAQRVCIARAIAAEPQCLLLDEAISSLDGSVQMQVLRLLQELRSTLDLGYIFITHDIQAAAYLCDRVMIIQQGRIVELVETAMLPHVRTPYARELLRKVMG